MTLETGTSGVGREVVVVMPFLMLVLPTRITRTPLASSTRSRSGNAAPPCETRIAGPGHLARQHRRVRPSAPPTNEPGGQLNGLAFERRRQARFLQRRQREGSCFGSCTITDLMFALAARHRDRRDEARAVGFRGLRAGRGRERRLEAEATAAFDLERRVRALACIGCRTSRSARARFRLQHARSWSG